MDIERRFRHAFGTRIEVEAPLAESGAGVRVTGIDLGEPLLPVQVECLLDALAHRRILCLAGQNLATFSLQHFERFANHWGAPVPHPSNFLRGGKPAQMDGDSLGAIEWRPLEQRMVSAVNGAFPDQLQCLPHESPAVLVVSNFRKPRAGGGSEGNSLRIGGGGSWHTDIEYEPLPIYVSMFLVHRMPTACTRQDDWIDADAVGHGPYFEGADATLTRRREALPRNAETCYADTAAAFAALPKPQQEQLLGVRVRRRLNEGDPGWLAPLVRTNPRSGLRSLHSPVWASRPRVRPPIEVEGMSAEESCAFLDELEAHVLKPEFRYDHPHVSGDVTIWDNYMTLHNSPPMKVGIDDVADARLLYRLSCKGSPALRLPRRDLPEWLATHIPGGYATPDRLLAS